MVDSIVEYLERDLACESLLDCIHGLKPLDRDCFQALVEADSPMTVDDLAAVVDRERSTAYRSVQRLHEAGLVTKEQINYEEGSYYHVFYPTDPQEIADEMQRTLNDWYAEMGQLIREFRMKYDEKHDRTVTAQS